LVPIVLGVVVIVFIVFMIRRNKQSS
jgi:hypothetical protein